MVWWEGRSKRPTYHSVKSTIMEAYQGALGWGGVRRGAPELAEAAHRVSSIRPMTLSKASGPREGKGGDGSR